MIIRIILISTIVSVLIVVITLHIIDAVIQKQRNKESNENKIEIKSVFGNVLFECKKENNTIRDTVIEAAKRDANLYDADRFYECSNGIHFFINKQDAINY